MKKILHILIVFFPFYCEAQPTDIAWLLEATSYSYCHTINATVEMGESYSFDVDNDTVKDFRLVVDSTSQFGKVAQLIALHPIIVSNPEPKTFLIRTTQTGYYAKNLDAGVDIEQPISGEWNNDYGWIYKDNGTGNQSFHAGDTGYIAYYNCVYVTIDPDIFDDVLHTCYGWLQIVVGSDYRSVDVIKSCGCDFHDMVTGEPFSPSGIEDELSLEPVSIYPNPSHGNFTLSLKTTTLGNFQVDVFDALGQTVYQTKGQTTGETKNLLTLEHLATGMYSLHVKLDEEMVHKKIMITH